MKEVNTDFVVITAQMLESCVIGMENSAETLTELILAALLVAVMNKENGHEAVEAFIEYTRDQDKMTALFEKYEKKEINVGEEDGEYGDS